MPRANADNGLMQQNKFNEILQRNPRRFQMSRLAVHVVLDASMMVAAWSLTRLGIGIAGSLAAGVLLSFFTFRSFGMMHDCVHGAGSPRKDLNRWLGEIYGVFCYLPFGSWRALHLDHHMWAGNVEKDPSMKILLNFEMHARPR